MGRTRGQGIDVFLNCADLYQYIYIRHFDCCCILGLHVYNSAFHCHYEMLICNMSPYDKKSV